MISSVGTVNYQHTTSQQKFVVSQNSQNFLNNGQPILTTQISHLQAPSAQQQQTQILPSPSCSSKKICSSQQQQQQQQNQPRQHPKKRKFDPAELEEMDSTANVVIKNGLMDNIYSTGLQNSENGSQTIKLEHIRLQPQQTLYTTQQQHSSPPTTIYKNIRIETPQVSQSGPELIDLGEWCDSRVLAKQKDYFVSGITRTTDISNAVIVEFDHPEGQQQIYQDVFGSGRFDIISDACPSASDVSSIFFLYFLFFNTKWNQ